MDSPISPLSDPAVASAKSRFNPDRFSVAELATVVALISLSMIFATLLVAYVYLRSDADIWPPADLGHIPWRWPTLGTALLGLSSIVMIRAQRQLAQLRVAAFRRDLNVCIALGCAFVVCQAGLWREFLARGLKGTSAIFATLSYLLTGTHVLHMLVAMGALVALRRMSFKPSFDATGPAPRLVGWFWHFLGAIWIPIFFALLGV